MNILVLEDAEYRISGFKKMLDGHNFCITGEPSVAIGLLQLHPMDILFLDHDLYGQMHVPSGPGTGWEVCKFLVDNPQFMPKRVILHSHNVKGVAEMQKLLPNAEVKSYGYFIVEGEVIRDLEEKLIL